MKIFNCSTNVKGGAVQNAVNFILELHEQKRSDDWFFICSPQVYEQIYSRVDHKQCISIESPAKSISARLKLKSLVKSKSPEFVYTSAGPAYVRFPCLSIMGCSNPFVLGADKLALDLYPLGERLKRYFRSLYQNMHLFGHDYYIVQTQYSKNQLIRKGISGDRIKVVGNAVSRDFIDYFEREYDINLCPENEKDNTTPVRVLIPSSFYLHKNLEIIPEVCRLLATESKQKFIFNLTITEREFQRLINGYDDVRYMMDNLGPYQHSKALQMYLQSDVIFLPSVLEVFSTSYIEAMAAMRPLVVPKLGFSYSICLDYPYYYSPLDPKSATVSLLATVDSKLKLSHSQLSFAKSIVNNYGSQSRRVSTILNILERVK